ncbi:class II glutamine amidotransferase [Francisella philomiragia]|uniref:Class II glutamine amidotransferase n=1 Tax=Francisella philomiragia TaxID=28110 RepID=A0ABS1GBT2_9GAMM|nr:class II glutamine amidotransferase [Francisella philomiragia]MBK2258561.1 class II glutamine amidotransferase [Francisella philomiragia]MBK2302269.1 class II glutamine amidotransferase [Francisella philomiragia]
MFSNILAISSDCPISPRINFLVDDTTTLQEFMWGIGWYHDNHNAVSIMKDNHVENLEALRALFDGNPNFCSSTFIGHIYSHSLFDKTNLNLQPFMKPHAGKEWTIVHNGDLNRMYQNTLILTFSDYEPVGKTDSEYILCWILSQLRKKNIRELNDDNLFYVYDLLKQINQVGQVNLVLSNGDVTIVYQDKDDFNPIYYKKFFPPSNSNNLDIGYVNVATGLYEDELRTYTIFSNNTNVDNTWRKLLPGQMVAVSHGRVIWNSDKNSSNYGGHTYQPDQLNVPTEIKTFKSSERILDIIHTTKYTYEFPVNLSKHNIRMKPIVDLKQRILNYDLSISVACEKEEYTDVFGNDVVFLKTKEPYKEFTIEMKTKVAVSTDHSVRKRSINSRTTMPISWMPWQRQMMTPYLLSVELPQTQLEELMDYAVSFVKRNDSDIMAVLDDINKTIYYEYKYVSGSTTFATTAYDVYITRQGVCQDFSNLFICLARLLGVPARYRSGYIFNGGHYSNTEMSDATHAWVEVYIPWVGWIGYDPTNGCEVNSDHVRIACGRTYIDATPTAGTIYRGGGTESLSINVKVFDVTGIL